MFVQTNLLFLFQHAEHLAEKKKALSDEAKRLYRANPGLFKAAGEDFKSIYSIIYLVKIYRAFLMYFYLNVLNICHTIILDFLPRERLDDLSSLLQLDSKNLDVHKLGLDAIKEQQRINLKFSSNKTAVLPEDKIQVMLAGVSLIEHTYPSHSNVFAIAAKPICIQMLLIVFF